MANKVYKDAKSALEGLLRDDLMLMCGGFGLVGIPEKLIGAVRESGVKGDGCRRRQQQSGLLLHRVPLEVTNEDRGEAAARAPFHDVAGLRLQLPRHCQDEHYISAC